MLYTLFGDMWGIHFIFRWLHLFFGIVWIGLLYYFNFVQGSFMAETTEATAKSQVLQKLLPRALWWFRWAAFWTFMTGFFMLSIRSHVDMSASGSAVFATPYWINILTGALLATLMFLNVWGIIWRKQKIVIANAQATAGGAAPNPLAAPAAARALVASRTNTLFSIPMMFFMVGANHLGYVVNESSKVGLYWVVALLIIFGIEANAIWGKTGPMTTVKGVIISGFVLTGIFTVLLTVLM